MLKPTRPSSTASCVGRPSERWGQEVVAVVQLRPGHPHDDDALLAEAGRHVARYKLPEGGHLRR